MALHKHVLSPSQGLGSWLGAEDMTYLGAHRLMGWGGASLHRVKHGQEDGPHAGLHGSGGGTGKGTRPAAS